MQRSNLNQVAGAESVPPLPENPPAGVTIDHGDRVNAGLCETSKKSSVLISFEKADRAGLRKESASDYSRVVTMIGNNARVIVCRDGIQWIVQRAKLCGHETQWRGLAYCRTKATLMRCVSALKPGMDVFQFPALADLPDQIEGGAK